jgi:hypothetical protein
VNRVPNDGFGADVARVVQERAELTRRSLGDTPFHLRMVEAAGKLSAHVAALPQDNTFLVALWSISAYHGDSDNFNPGTHQTDYLANLGLTGEPPATPEVLGGLIAAGVEDLAEMAAAQRTQQSQALQAAVAEKAEEFKANEQELKAKLADTEGGLSDATSEVADLKQQLEALRRLVPGNKKKPEPKEEGGAG